MLEVFIFEPCYHVKNITIYVLFYLVQLYDFIKELISLLIKVYELPLYVCTRFCIAVYMYLYILSVPNSQLHCPNFNVNRCFLKTCKFSKGSCCFFTNNLHLFNGIHTQYFIHNILSTEVEQIINKDVFSRQKQ